MVMNAAARTAVQSTPIPVEGGIPVEAAVTTDATGAWRTVWCFDGGRRKEIFGPPLSLREALDRAAALNARGWAE